MESETTFLLPYLLNSCARLVELLNSGNRLGELLDWVNLIRAAQCIDKEILISKNGNIDIEIDKRMF